MGIGDGKKDWAMGIAKVMFGSKGEVGVSKKGECLMGFWDGRRGSLKVIGRGKDWESAVEDAREKFQRRVV